jgi:hypothetical protein
MWAQSQSGNFRDLPILSCLTNSFADEHGQDLRFLEEPFRYLYVFWSFSKKIALTDEALKANERRRSW